MPKAAIKAYMHRHGVSEEKAEAAWDRCINSTSKQVGVRSAHAMCNASFLGKVEKRRGIRRKS